MQTLNSISSLITNAASTISIVTLTSNQIFTCKSISNVVSEWGPKYNKCHLDGKSALYTPTTTGTSTGAAFWGLTFKNLKNGVQILGNQIMEWMKPTSFHQENITQRINFTVKL